MTQSYIYGYVDESGFLYPPSAGLPFEDSMLDNLKPITNRAEYIRTLDRLKRKPPSEFFVGETLEETQATLQAEAEAAALPENRGIEKAAIAALSATNEEGRTKHTRKVTPRGRDLAPPVITDPNAE